MSSFNDSCCQTFFDIILGIGTLIALLFACGSLGARENWFSYMSNVDISDSYRAVQNTKYFMDLSQSLAISGYAFFILVLVIVTAVAAYCKTLPLRAIIALLVLLVFSSVCALLSNIGGLVLAVIATYQFNAVAPSFLNSSLYNSRLYDLTNDTLESHNETSGIDWHRMQFQLQCCGVYGYGDYQQAGLAWQPRNPNASAPLSCCVWTNPEGESYPSSANGFVDACVFQGVQSFLYNKKGCFDALQSYVLSAENTVIVLTCAVISQVTFTHFVRLYLTIRPRNV